MAEQPELKPLPALVEVAPGTKVTLIRVLKPQTLDTTPMGVPECKGMYFEEHVTSLSFGELAYLIPQSQFLLILKMLGVDEAWLTQKDEQGNLTENLTHKTSRTH
jgi:hypothetical protein